MSLPACCGGDQLAIEGSIGVGIAVGDGIVYWYVLTPKIAAPTVMVSVTTPRCWLREMLETAVFLRLMRRPELMVAGWNLEIEAPIN